MRQSAWTALLIGLLAVTMAACGKPAANPQAPGASQAAAQAKGPLAYSACMRAHGVPKFPDLKAGKPGGPIGMRVSNNNGVLTVDGVKLNADSAAFDAAQKACRGTQEPGTPINPAQLAKMKAQALAYAKCMRAHGVPEFPDPEVSSHGVGFRITGMNMKAPSFRAAQKACAHLMPGPGGS